MKMVLLLLAGLAEVGFAVFLKLADGFTKLTPSILSVVFGGISFALLGLALKRLPVGPAYAIWTGIGIVGATVVGVVFLGEHLGWPKVVAIALIAVGAVSLSVLEVAK